MHNGKMWSVFAIRLIGVIYISIIILISPVLFDIISASFHFFIFETDLFDFLLSWSKDDRALGISFIIAIPFFTLLFLFLISLKNQTFSLIERLKNKGVSFNERNKEEIHLEKFNNNSIFVFFLIISNKSKNSHINLFFVFCAFLLSFFIILFQTCTCITAFLYCSRFGDCDKTLFVLSNKLLIPSLLIDYFIVTFFALKGMLFQINKILSCVLASRIMKKY